MNGYTTDNIQSTGLTYNHSLVRETTRYLVKVYGETFPQTTPKNVPVDFLNQFRFIQVYRMYAENPLTDICFVAVFPWWYFYCKFLLNIYLYYILTYI